MKLLIGGSPCTHWSIAQTKNRETTAEGIGWELFLNYRIARDKYRPDYFLYENNKSMSPAIRAQITAELGVEPVLINSALVSAQNRQRLYWAGRRNPDGTYSQVRVEQPEDRGILLRDILETGVAWQEKAYCITATEYKGSNVKQTLTKHRRTMVAEPIRIGTIENDAKNPDHDSQQYRVYSPDGKSVTLCGNGGGLGAKTGLYAVPAPVEYEPLHSCDLVITDQNIRCTYKDGSGTAQGYTVTFDDMKAPSVIAGHANKMKIIERATGKETPVYEVRGGRITIKDKEYPIKLRDGCYIIRKLTVTECKRLQTVPDTYAFPVSNSQAYKMLGNGWTVDVIAHIMSHFDGLTEEPVEVLSMYDGMSCGHIALDKLGVSVAAYYATEIDKYAVQTTQHNYPETVQLGGCVSSERGELEIMTRDEIVTSLRCCVSVGLGCCKTCPVAQEDGCEDAIKVYAANLIENQQREIEALLQANDALRERQRKRKAVLVSIKPKWCKKIVDGEKTIELRKAKPRIPTPFKCYIYCTPEQPDLNIPISQEQLMRDYLDTGSMECLNCPLGNGKVIGEFVCDNVYELDLAHAIDVGIFMKSCVGAHEMYGYLGRKTGYGWHISDLKIYEQPKELSELCAPQDAYCERRRPIAHAPRNWCYVEEG